MPTIVEVIATRATQPKASTIRKKALLLRLRLQALRGALSEIGPLRTARLHRPQGEMPSNPPLARRFPGH
jgi:hypothetical protein